MSARAGSAGKLPMPFRTLSIRAALFDGRGTQSGDPAENAVSLLTMGARQLILGKFLSALF